MPTIAVGLLIAREVLAALHEEAQRSGERSRACLVTPCLIAVAERDLARLAARPRGDVHYDGRRLWVHGVDWHVQP